MEAVSRQRVSQVAWLGACFMVLASPFERLQPLVRLPGQVLSSVETVLIVVVLAWLAACVAARVVPQWRTPFTWPWIAFGLASFVAALVSSDRGNALHMAGRIAPAFAVYLITVNGVTSLGRLRSLLVVAAGAGAIVAFLAVLEYFNVAAVVGWLGQFRVNTAYVGAQIRAGGPFQYPTITSMYLEIVFALTLGLLLSSLDTAAHHGLLGRRALTALLAVVLVAITQAVTLTFTRAGLITSASTLAVVAFLRVRQLGVDRGVLTLAAVSLAIVLQILTSRSVESLRLRMTTEGQNAWYRATIDAPAHLAMQTGDRKRVPLTLTNTGYSSWDPEPPNRFRLSYHWLLLNDDRVMSWEGARTDFSSVVRAGERVTLQAEVIAPRQPGEFRILWDIEREDRSWFSTEPDADRFFSRATISGPAAGTVDVSTLPILPKRSVRPGRLVLWRAAGRMLAEHPIVGVGPDNFRLKYGLYAGLASADPRVHTNNMYLEVLTGGGLLAGLPFFWLLWSVWQRTTALALASDWTTTPLISGIIAAVAAIALHGLVDSFMGFTGTYILMALTLGLVVAAGRLTPLAPSGPAAIHASPQAVPTGF